MRFPSASEQPAYARIVEQMDKDYVVGGGNCAMAMK